MSIAHLIDEAAGPRRERRGRPEIDVQIGEPRSLREEDLALPKVKTESSVVRLRQSHHAVARLLAQGADPVEVAAVSGYTPVRINQLKADPSFQELMAHYTSIEQEEYERTRGDMHDRLAALGFDAMEVLHEKLLEDSDSFTKKELLAIVEASADRTGYGKTQTLNANVSHSLNSADLARLKEASSPPGPVLAETTREALLVYALRQTESVREVREGSLEGASEGGHLLPAPAREGTPAEEPR